LPCLIAFAGLIAAAGLWAMRMRAAAQVTQELAGMASDVMAAARRLGFRRRHALHPVESVDEPKLAIGGIALAFMELGGLPTAEQQNALMTSLTERLDLGLKDAEETLILGRWLVSESGGPQQGIDRLARRLVKLDRAGSFTPLMDILKDTAAAGRGEMLPRQREALAEIARAFKIA
jgi:hypothetical protein